MDLAEKINKAARLSGEFQLRSGVVSNTYFDKYKLESDPKLLLEIVNKMKALVPENTEVLAGLEMGGIPLVTLLSQITSLPCSFIRKSAKEYGTCNYIEGSSLENKNIVIIEDVVSSGGAIIEAVNAMRNDGIEVNTAICVIDRETGGCENLQSIGIELISIFKSSDLN